jgi:hypothetical protein
MTRLIYHISFFLLAAMTANLANATVHRVNNTPGVDADFNNLATAISTAIAGDTLYVEGSNSSYGTVTLDKKLILVGPGNFLTINDSTQALKQVAEISNLTFNTGCDGSVIYGMYINGRVDINEDSVSLYRNRIYYTSSGNMIDLQNGVKNIVIAQNHIHSNYTTNVVMFINDNCTGILIANNWISQDQSSEFGLSYNCYSSSYMAIEDQYTNSEVTYLNNVIRGNWECDYAIAINNIHVAGCIYHTGTVFYNNIGYNSNLPAGNGNQINVSMATVFERSGVNWYQDDNWWKLAAGSPALGAGVNGEDCGMFGGGLSYVLSGMPPIPAIFEADVPATANKTNGMNVEVKSMSHK